MRRAVLTDVHGNLHALKATLKSIDDAEVDRLICLGDTVGYGAHPAECIELIRERCAVVLAGNHDWGVAGMTSLLWFNADARDAARWTRKQLSQKQLDWLEELPLEVREGDIHFVHGSPESPEHWLYVRGALDAEHALKLSGARLLFVGHSHMAAIHRFVKGAVVIAGSVGQPRDGDPRAGWCLFDDETGELEIVRVKYDVKGAQEAIRSTGLPDWLADRLALGV